jgi:hypothetical protein
MALVTVEQVHFVEVGDYEFCVEFMMDAHTVRTGPLPRTATKPEVAAAVKAAARNWTTARAQANYDALRAQYEGQSLEVDL